jgi:uncharacterized protein with FMN-binding domain
MRRGVLAIIGTVAGTALMVGAKLGTAPAGDPNAAAMDAAAGSEPAAPSGSSGAAGPAPSDSPAGPVPSGGPSRSAPAPGSTTGKPTPVPGPTTPAAGGLKNGTFTGAGAPAKRYEVVTVTISVSGGKITVANGSCGSASGESRSICTGAMPRLQQDTLARQSANVATVSGATYTSGAYKASLQSAIDQAKA